MAKSENSRAHHKDAAQGQESDSIADSDYLETRERVFEKHKKFLEEVGRL